MLPICGMQHADHDQTTWHFHGSRAAVIPVLSVCLGVALWSLALCPSDIADNHSRVAIFGAHSLDIAVCTLKLKPEPKTHKLSLYKTRPYTQTVSRDVGPTYLLLSCTLCGARLVHGFTSASPPQPAQKEVSLSAHSVTGHGAGKEFYNKTPRTAVLNIYRYGSFWLIKP